MALQVGNKVRFAKNSPFFYNEKEYEVTEVKVVTTEDLKNGYKVSLGVKRLIQRKGSVILVRISGMQKNESMLPINFFKKIQ